MNLPKTTFYRWINSSDLDIPEDEKSIIDICKKNKYRYGYRKVHAVLKSFGYKTNHKKVLRIMRKNNILARVRRKNKKFTSGATSIIAPNILKRDFKSQLPNTKWFTDITYLKFSDKTLYLSAIMDGFNGEIIAYKVNDTQDISLVKDTLNDAILLNISKDLILHSDQGAVYTSPCFQKLVNKSGITMSMSRRGNCHDNAAMESFFSSLKTEAFYSQGLKGLPTKRVIEIVSEYIHYYNEQRIQAKLNYLSLVEYRKKVA